jgi:septal ring factor EnvC (AmiA/AmiB activator)
MVIIVAVKKKVAATKKPRAATGLTDPTGNAAFTVVLEDIRAQFGVFGEALQGLREHMDARFEQVDARFEQVDARFEQVDAKFAEIHRELGLVKTVAIDHGRQLSEHGRMLADHGQQLGEIRKTVASIETKLDAKVERSEVVTIVEAALSKRR